MSKGEFNAVGTIAGLYRTVTRLYTELPYRFSRAGSAFPASHYFFEVTRRCNLRCKMCQYIDWLETVPTKMQADGELTTEEWLSVIDQTGPFSLITFTGGEVFVRKDFMQILEHACSKRRVHFITNATMLTEERARQLVKLAPKRLGGKGFNFAGISLDGPRDIHDVIRAQKGSFDRSVNGVKCLNQFRKEAGKQTPLVHINTVMQTENMHVLHEMPAIVKECGAHVLNLLTEMRAHDIPELGHKDPSNFQRSDINMPTIETKMLDEALRKTKAEADKHGIEIRMPRTFYDEVIKYYDRGYDLVDYECRAIWTNIIVGSKGGVYPCFIKKVGNVRENTLKELWNSPEMQTFRKFRRHGGFAVCQGCCELEHKDYHKHVKTDFFTPIAKLNAPGAADAKETVSVR